MKRNTQDLEEIAHLTLEHYNQHAGEFWQGTRDHDVSQNIAALLQCIRNEPPFKILDFGCGPGRDLKTFAELGYIAIGLEGADPPPLKWSDLRYVFDIKEDCNGKEAIQA